MAGTAAALASVALNPRSAVDFGSRHVILNGRTSKPMHVASFAGPFSIKSVAVGRATWETKDGRYVLTPGHDLILGRGTRYSLTIDGDAPVETFCVFFQDGFVEAALRSITEPDARLLDTPEDRAESFALLEAVQDDAHPVGAQLVRLRRIIHRDGVGSLALSGAMHAAAVAVVNRSSALLVRSRRTSGAITNTSRAHPPVVPRTRFHAGELRSSVVPD